MAELRQRSSLFRFISVLRRNVWPLVSFVLVIIPALFPCQDWNRGAVVAVSDGDSPDLADGRRVRLLGLDAPERGRCMAEKV
ncbi:hypothetical protein M1555_02055 [Patescibacteria group bacterium]|nr:hypothetical protein [Patescibacteria group bacterium]